MEHGDAPADLDDALQAIFGDPGDPKDAPPPSAPPRRSSAGWNGTVAGDVYRWTGWFPERARHLMGQLADRAEQQRRTYPEDRESAAIVALTAFVTALALSRVQGGDGSA